MVDVSSHQVNKLNQLNEIVWENKKREDEDYCGEKSTQRKEKKHMMEIPTSGGDQSEQTISKCAFL